VLLFDIVHDTGMGRGRRMSHFHLAGQTAVDVCSTVAEFHYRVQTRGATEAAAIGRRHRHANIFDDNDGMDHTAAAVA
jgi:hypothetical protein